MGVVKAGSVRYGVLCSIIRHRVSAELDSEDCSVLTKAHGSGHGFGLHFRVLIVAASIRTTRQRVVCCVVVIVLHTSGDGDERD